MNVCKCFPPHSWRAFTLTFCSGDTCLDGQHILVSNLRDGVNRYAIPAFHQAQSYHHTMLVNVLLQLSIARKAGLVIVGGDNGFARIFDH
jgi:hypothetical protein